MDKLCYTCKKPEEGLRKCSRCQQVYYCSKDCQAKNWPQHKLVCSKIGEQTSPSFYKGDVCHHCKSESAFLKRCSGCLLVFYCSTECQAAAWNIHKRDCKKRETNEDDGIFEHLFQPCSGCGCLMSDFKKIVECKGCSATYCTKYCCANEWPKHKYFCSREHREKFDLYMTELIVAKTEPETKCNTCFSTEELKCCSKCHRIKYCSKGCQKKDWKNHKYVCIKQTENYTDKMILKLEIELKLKQISVEKTQIFNKGRYTRSKSEIRFNVDTSSPSARSALQYVDKCDLTIYNLPEHTAWEKAITSARQKYPKHFNILTNMDDVLVEDSKQLKLLLFIPRYHHYRGRHCVYVEDLYGKELYIAFYIEEKEFPRFDWSSIKPGRFILISNPTIHNFIDSSIGFRLDSPDLFEYIDV